MSRRHDHIFRWMGLTVTGDVGPYTFYTTKRKGMVWFDRAPPLVPPSPAQIRQRNAFRLAAFVWQSLSEQARQNWERATKLLSLNLHGYNLFVYWSTTADHPAIQTIERQSGISLIPLEENP